MSAASTHDWSGTHRPVVQLEISIPHPSHQRCGAYLARLPICWRGVGGEALLWGFGIHPSMWVYIGRAGFMRIHQRHGTKKGPLKAFRQARYSRETTDGFIDGQGGWTTYLWHHRTRPNVIEEILPALSSGLSLLRFWGPSTTEEIYLGRHRTPCILPVLASP